MLLLTKPRHSDFNPLSEMFNKIPIWVKLPYLPLHMWVDYVFEEIGDAIESFIMVDNDSYGLYHTTFARILVELDVSKGLPAKIAINSSFGSWVQTLDCEGISFRGRRCFKTSHAAGNCGLEKKNYSTSWCSGASHQHYTIRKSLDTPKESLDVGVSTLVGSNLTMKDSLDATKDSSKIKDVVIQDVVVPSIENRLLSLTLPVSLCVDTTFAPPVGCGHVFAMVSLTPPAASHGVGTTFAPSAGRDPVPTTVVAPSSDTLSSSPERSVMGPSNWSIAAAKVDDGLLLRGSIKDIQAFF